MTTTERNAHLHHHPGRIRTPGPAIGLGAVVIAAMVLVAGPAMAGGWNVTMDLAAFSENTYPGSGESYLTALPSLRATRTEGLTTWFVHLPGRGLGVSRVDPSTGLTGTFAANFGGERGPDQYSVVGFAVDHDAATRARLAGAPTVSTPLFLEASLEYPAASGLLGATLAYHPTSIEGRPGGLDDQTRHGLLLSLEYTRPLRITDRLLVAGRVGLELMDGSYASAWFGLDHATATLARHDAGAGFRDVQASVFANYQVSSHVGLMLYYGGELLLGDAADSPYTVDSYQQTYLLGTSYTF